ncbi:murein hydrolase activator EnvC family protein [Kingella kingae]|uniref:murein hydrolase activator EnvC family protein n=1 Tax=Kingella kingae TaxID=504 RepID=UPI00040B60CC|nr:M23 family metallopeptidase [Kingella kingae]
MRLPNFSMIYVLAISLLLSACSGVSNNTASGSCSSPSTGFYCVKAGDNLYRIGQRYGVSVVNLKSWNQLSGDHIRAGQMLRIQKSTARSSTSSKQPATTTSLLMPVADGTIIQSYSDSTRSIQIAAPQGSNVLAAADGMVIYAGEGLRGYGKLMLIQHSNQLITAYAHNQTLLVGKNARVKRGQPVATVGNTARADGRSALHFEVRLNGKAVNPAPYLNGAR